MVQAHAPLPILIGGVLPGARFRAPVIAWVERSVRRFARPQVSPSLEVLVMNENDARQLLTAWECAGEPLVSHTLQALPASAAPEAPFSKEAVSSPQVPQWLERIFPVEKLRFVAEGAKEGWYARLWKVLSLSKIAAMVSLAFLLVIAVQVPHIWLNKELLAEVHSHPAAVGATVGIIFVGLVALIFLVLTLGQARWRGMGVTPCRLCVWSEGRMVLVRRSALSPTDISATGDQIGTVIIAPPHFEENRAEKRRASLAAPFSTTFGTFGFYYSLVKRDLGTTIVLTPVPDPPQVASFLREWVGTVPVKPPTLWTADAPQPSQQAG